MEEAGQLAGADRDYSIKDLFEAIATGSFVICSLGNTVDVKGLWLMHSQACTAIMQSAK